MSINDMNLTELLRTLSILSYLNTSMEVEVCFHWSLKLRYFVLSSNICLNAQLKVMIGDN